MKIVMRNLDEIRPYENNPRVNDKAAVAVAKSIEAYGFKVPVVISADGEIVCGHTRYKAAQQLKLESVPCIVADDLTPEQIKAFRLADNKVSDVSIWDNKKLLQELQELDELGNDLFTGFEWGGCLTKPSTKAIKEWSRITSSALSTKRFLRATARKS